MKTILQGTSFFLLFLCLLFTQCSKTPNTPVTPKSSTKTLTSPTIDGITGASITFDAATSTYTVTVPSGTDVTALKVSFTLPTGATSKPTLGSAQNFTNPVIYTVTAEDGSTQTYTVKVVITGIPKSAEKQITAFTFAALSPVVTAIIDQTARKITATIPATADLSSLVPTITLAPKSTVSPVSGVVQNFTNPVNYTVTAEDGSKQSYEVRVEKTVVTNTEYNNTIFVGGYDKKIYALDTKTGAQKWAANTGSDYSDSYPMVANGAVYAYIGSGNPFVGLSAFDARNGNKLWSSAETVQSNSYCYADGIVYAVTNKGVVAIDAQSGSTKWSFATTNASVSNPLVVSDGIVYATTDRIYALDSKTGSKKWESINVTNFFSEGFAPPAVLNGLVFSAFRNRLYAFDTKTGTKKWETLSKNDNYFTGSPTIDNGFAYVACADKYVYVIDIQNGTIKNTVLPGNNNSSFGLTNSPTSADGIVYITNQGALYAFGDRTWTIERNSGTGIEIGNPSPTVAEGVVYIAGFENNVQKLFGFDAKTGSKVWSSVAGSFYSSPCVVGATGKVYYAGSSGMQQ